MGQNKEGNRGGFGVLPGDAQNRRVCPRRVVVDGQNEFLLEVFQLYRLTYQNTVWNYAVGFNKPDNPLTSGQAAGL